MNRLLTKHNGISYKILLVLLVAILCTFPLGATAQTRPKHIHIVSSLSNQAQTEFIVTLNNKLNLHNAQLTYSTPDKIPENGIDTYIVAGLQAALLAAEKLKDKNVIYTLISQQQFSGIRTSIIQNGQNYRVLYIEQPYSRYLKIIKTVLPETSKIGFITSNSNSEQINKLINQASVLGLNIVSAKASDTNEAIAQLSRIVTQCDVLLTTYDTVIYNRNSIKNILLTTYYGNIPIIGFSESFLNAGAYLSIYTSPSEYGAQTADLVMLDSTNSNIREFYPEEFTTKINQSIARTLSLPYYSSEDLARMLK